MAIDKTLHQAEFTAALVASFRDNNQDPILGLEALFPNKVAKSKYVKVHVMRNGRKVAVDVKRCTDANLNQFTEGKEKIILPPYFREGFDITQCEAYKYAFVRNQFGNSAAVQDLFADAEEKLRLLKNKIQRAVEKMRADVLQTGILTFKSQDSIDYGRKAQSIKVVDNKWDSAGADIIGDLTTGVEFLRNEGRSFGQEIMAICGAKALGYIIGNTKLLEANDYRRANRLEITMPQAQAKGFTYHGRIAVGDFIVNLMTYSDTYEDKDGNAIPYIDADKVILMPSDFEGLTTYASVPALFEEASTGAQFIGEFAGEFYQRDYVDQVVMNWMHEISSAPVVIPVSVDKMYTLKVLA